MSLLSVVFINYLFFQSSSEAQECVANGWTEIRLSRTVIGWGEVGSVSSNVMILYLIYVPFVKAA